MTEMPAACAPIAGKGSDRNGVGGLTEKALTLVARSGGFDRSRWGV